MARSLRVDDPGMWHHVMHRGNSRCKTFLDDADRQRFLAAVARAVARFSMRVHAYCLMSNHYHLLVEDTGGHLSAAMQAVNGAYTQSFNRRHGRDGALFRGRFHSRAVQQDSHALACLRYIHMNPVEAGLVDAPHAYVWSSHRAYLAGIGPDWLSLETMTAACSVGPIPDAAALHAYVTGEAGPTYDPASLRSAAWGEADWLDGLRTTLRRTPTRMGADVPAGRRLGGVTVDEAVTLVAAVCGVEVSALRRGGRGKRHLARDVAINLLLRFSSLSQGQIASEFGLRGRGLPWSARRYDGPVAEAARRLASEHGLYRPGDAPEPLPHRGQGPLPSGGITGVLRFDSRTKRQLGGRNLHQDPSYHHEQL